MNFFRDTSIRNKILIPPMIMMIALASVLTIAIYGFNKQRLAFSKVQEIAIERTTLVNEFMALSDQVQADVFRISALRFMKLPEREIKPAYSHLEQGMYDLKVIYGQILTKWSLDVREKKTFEQMKAPLDAFRKQAKQAVTLISKNPSFGILLVRSATAPFAQFRGHLDQFMRYQKEKIIAAETSSLRTAETIKTATVAIALFTACTAILLTVLISARFISRPIRSITGVMSQLAQGELAVEIGDLGRQDEIGLMAQAVEVFRKTAVEKQFAEEALRTSEANYRTIFDTANDAIFIHDLNTGQILDINRKMCEMYGYTPEEARSVDVERLSAGQTPFTQDEALKWINNAAQGEPQLFEWHARGKAGNLFWVEVNLKRITIGDEARLLAIVREITHRKKAEKQLNRSLEEKEVLLREIHHRVKNNLQVTSGLLKLQSANLKDKQALEILNESQNRIRSMALVHDQLYQSQDLANIKFKDYVKDLIQSQFASYGVDPDRISSIIEMEGIFLQIDLAMPCGLIINELVSNSLKYAFPPDKKGQIRVALRSINEDELELEFCDDGLGIPIDLDFRKTQSFGLHLVRMLAEGQLEGKIELNRKKGTEFTIRFNRTT